VTSRPFTAARPGSSTGHRGTGVRVAAWPVKRIRYRADQDARPGRRRVRHRADLERKLPEDRTFALRHNRRLGRVAADEPEHPVEYAGVSITRPVRDEPDRQRGLEEPDVTEHEGARTGGVDPAVALKLLLRVSRAGIRAYPVSASARPRARLSVRCRNGGRGQPLAFTTFQVPPKLMMPSPFVSPAFVSPT
jgi:hypothetical protein